MNSFTIQMQFRPARCVDDSFLSNFYSRNFDGFFFFCLCYLSAWAAFSGERVRETCANIDNLEMTQYRTESGIKYFKYGQNNFDGLKYIFSYQKRKTLKLSDFI